MCIALKATNSSWAFPMAAGNEVEKGGGHSGLVAL